MSDLITPLAGASVSGPTLNLRPRGTQPYDSILDATGAWKIVFNPAIEVYCRVAFYTDADGNWDFICDGRRRNERALHQHLFEGRGPHRSNGEVIRRLSPEERRNNGPLRPCILPRPSAGIGVPANRAHPSLQQQQQHAQLAHRPPPNQGLYHIHPGLQSFTQQQQQQAQPLYAPPPNQGFYQAPLSSQQPPRQQQFTQHAQLNPRPAPNQGFNHAPLSSQPPAQQQQQQNQLAYCPAPSQSTYHIHYPGQVSAQQHQHSQLAYRPAQNQGFYNGQHSGQPPAQQQQHQHFELTYRPAPSQSYYHGHLSGQLPAQQQQQLQHAQSPTNQPNVVPYPAPLISQDLYDLAWAAKLRSEQQQIVTIQPEGPSHDFEIVIDSPPPPPSERWNPLPQHTVIEALDEAPDAAEAAIAACLNRDGPAQESVWIDGPEGARILKCFWQRGELYVQPEDGYMFYGYGRWRRREEDVPVSMEVGTVICGCFQRDGELWVQDDPEGKYNRYGFEYEM